MADSVSEVTQEGFFSRLMDSIKGVLFGLLLFIVAFPCLAWNEYRSVTEWQQLQAGRGAVMSVEADTIDPANEGELVHITGKATTDETLTDAQFGVSENAIKLERSVEMYQWKQNTEKEKRKKVGGGTETVTTYTYEQVWAPDLISSSKFKEPEGHQNPTAMPFEGESFRAKKVTLGAFDLSDGLIASIDAWEDIEVSPEAISGLPEPLQEQAQSHDGGFYIGTNPTSPSIGDLRVQFEVVRPTVVTVVAGQDNTTLDKWETPVGGTLSMLQVGTKSADQMFTAAEESSVALTWGLRIGGFFAMFIGLTMILRPFTVMADVIPVFGSIVSLGAGVVACGLSSFLSLGTIAVSWIAVRPILGIALCSISILALVGLIVVGIAFGKRRSAAAQEAPA